jgi:hypothetical protein
MRRLTIALGLCLIACGGSGDSTEPESPGNTTGTAAAVSVSPPTTDVQVGATTQLTATTTDDRGRALSGATYRWSSQAPNLVGVSQGGLVTAFSPGVVRVSAESQTSIYTGVGTVTARAPSRITGSFLRIGFDGTLTSATISKVGMADTARAGRDYRLGLAHTADGATDGFTVTRSSWPLLRIVTECTSGQVYASENSTGSNGDRLWSVNPTSLIVTIAADNLSIGPTDITSMTCEQDGAVVLSALFAGFSYMYRYTPGSGVRLIRQYDTDRILGIAQSAGGVLYATVRALSGSTEGHRLYTVNATTGALTQVSAQISTPQVTQLFFRGGRLLGLTDDGTLVEVAVQSGAVTALRSSIVP